MGIGDTSAEGAPRAKRESKKAELLGFVLLAAGVMIVAAGAYGWQKELTVETIAVDGNRIVTVDEITALSGVTPGSKLGGIALTAIRERLLRNAFIKNAVVRREFPSQIAVTVEERTPVAFLGTGELLTCDADGIVLPHIVSGEVANLPLISGLRSDARFETGKKLDDSTAAEALGILRAAAAIDPPMAQMISEIRPAADGGMMLITADGGVPVAIGRGRIAEKLVKLASFWKQVVLPETGRRPESVDVRYQDQVIVRWAGNARTSSQPG